MEGLLRRTDFPPGVAMALVTYTLLAAFASGLQSRFHPEVLGISLSKSFAVVIFEFLCIRSVVPRACLGKGFVLIDRGACRLGCYLLDVRGSGASGVELIGYGGYKFVG
jgi:hypothetical protein